MNTNLVSSHLREAAEQISKTLSEIQKNPDYDEVHLKADVEHILDQIHSAYNMRDLPDDQSLTRDEFHKLRRPPTDIHCAVCGRK
jgi:hypothetical protein